jgi:hypothetical protein
MDNANEPVAILRCGDVELRSSDPLVLRHLLSTIKTAAGADALAALELDPRIRVDLPNAS